MYYFKVLVSSPKYHGNEALTYSSDQKITVGSLVIVPLQATKTQGIVVGSTSQPSFKVKPIIRVTIEQPLPAVTVQLMTWLGEYYPAPSSNIVSQFIPSGLMQVPAKPKKHYQNQNTSLPVLPPLTVDQSKALDAIAVSKPGTSIILHGATGSGKTRVYIEAARAVRLDEKDTLILTPEISLTPQLVREFESAFQTTVILLHSNLSVAERRNAWLKVLYATEPVIVIGPRSALFAPVRNLGLIVVDESHESTYKQEPSPNYDGRRVASKLAQLHGAKAIFGSATPNVTDYYVAKSKAAPIIRLEKLAVNEHAVKPSIKIIMARDREKFTRHPYLSDDLLDGVRECLNHKEQALIFLNRRGTARLLLCQVCGWQATCPNCDLPLTYHGDSHLLRCHTCGFNSSAPSRCPECGSTDIIFRSHGTKSIVEAISTLFPKAKVQRFDTDNSKAERFEQHYDAVSRGEVDILIGTQMLTKGLDLPKLSFVGVISADTSLSFPDYTASERTYQLLTQVIGRIARGHRKGSAVIQTFRPESPAIQAAVKKDWDSFYEAEIRERKQFGFPPFWYLLKLSCVRKTIKGAQKTAGDLSVELKHNPHIQVIGPSPSFYEKQDGNYRWQIIVKAKNRTRLIEVIKSLPSNWNYDIDPTNLL